MFTVRSEGLVMAGKQQMGDLHGVRYYIVQYRLGAVTEAKWRF
jgi:ribosomal protein S12